MSAGTSRAPQARKGQPATDQRRERREDWVRRVEYSPFPRRAVDQHERTGFTRDVSPSGLCLRADVAEPTGSLLRLVVRGADGRPTLESVARVAWRRENADGGWWLGLSLVDGRESRSRALPNRPPGTPRRDR